MATTTNFGWETPDDTDLVKDGALAMRTLGNSIDTSFVDLKGGTTGQVLSKASNTDLDFTWVAQDDSNAIQNALLTTTGDTIYASAASTPARLAIGTTGQVLTVSGGVPVWATSSSGGFTLIQDQQASASSAINFSSISGSYKHLLLTWEGLGSTTDSSTAFSVRFNSDSGSNYINRGISFIGTTATANSSANTSVGFGKFIGQGFQGAATTDRSRGYLWIYNYASTTRFKSCVGSSTYNDQGLGEYFLPMLLTTYISTSAITDINIVRLAGTGNITNNTSTSIRLYGVS